MADSTLSKKHQVIDFRDDHLTKTLLRLSIPAIIENVLMIAVYMVNAIIVGWLRDESALAATMLAGSFMMLMGTPFQAISVGANSLVARSWGERDFVKAKTYARQVLCLGWFFAILVTIIGYFSAPFLLTWMGASPKVINMGTMFLRIVILSLPLEAPLFLSSGILRGTGDTRTPMKITLIMNAFNIGLSWLFAFGCGPIPARGLMGAAWGAMIAQSLGGVIGLIVLTSGFSQMHIRLREIPYWNPIIISRLWNISYPVMIERFITTGAGIFFMKIVAMLGTTALAAHNVALRIESIAFMPPWGLNVAIGSIVGQSLGAGRPEFAEKTVYKALGWIWGFMIILGVIFIFFSHPIVIIFRATPEVIRMAGTAVQLASLELPFIASFAVLAGCLRGAGDTRSPLYVMIVCLILFRFGVVYTFAITFHWGLPGVWIATAIDWVGRSAGLWYVFRKGRWKIIHPKLSNNKLL